jgi:hypothetical protein
MSRVAYAGRYWLTSSGVARTGLHRLCSANRSATHFRRLICDRLDVWRANLRGPANGRKQPICERCRVNLHGPCLALNRPTHRQIVDFSTLVISAGDRFVE